MEIQQHIENYIASQPAPKSSEMQTLHSLILQINPNCKLWYLDGKDATGKVVSNPNIGYGSYTIHYANGTNKEFYQIGLSGNTTGISVYIMGLKDKQSLTRNFGATIGKASVTGYCIKFKALKDINLKVLEAAIRFGFEERS